MSSRSYLIVGHGGQGVLDLGNFIAYDAILRGQKVAYTPSYGPETRGGKVRCYVIRSEEEIDSPIVDEPDVLIAMNNPSMDFEPLIKPKGLLLMNTSLIDRNSTRKDVETVRVPATQIADGMKSEVTDLPDTRVLQNAVMYGAVVGSESDLIDEDRTRSVLAHVYSGTKSRFVPANLQAVLRGVGFVNSSRRSCQLWGS
ncbi:MAG TPA: 2-oxoacid:acceptor oxidoreductase family protein [Candidatus Bathyarchaeia archaeon]|jgi:2-oxoglutarate ferredoxin oxidoreductase subunit gamma|nr:2-oxoacid:acceptor oxidoreductase family protein [Candidatus Bathyarchaeia archaeon]